MSRILRELLAAREPTFSLRLRQLESATGRRTLDIALTAEILSKLADKLKVLALDPLDTTAQELHASLRQKALDHDELLRRTYHNQLSKMVDALNDKSPTAQVPILKSATLRKIVSTNPPKKVMAALGYRSVASLQKRADLDQILLGCFLLESVTWHRAFTKKLKSLKPSDVTMARPKALIIDSKIIAKAEQKHANPFVQCAGIVGINTESKDRPGAWLHIAAGVAEGLFLVHQRGVYIKLHRFSQDIVKLLVRLTYTSPGSVATVGRVGITWPAVYTFMSTHKHTLDDVDEAIVEVKDFFWKSPAEILSLAHRQIDFWSDSELVAKPDQNKPVSLNVSDIAFDALHQLPYGHGSHGVVSRNLTAELLARYFAASPERSKHLKSIGILS